MQQSRGLTAEGWGMIPHYLRLGAISLRRQPALTALMVCIMAFGIAATSVTYAAWRVATADPMPSKASHLFFPQIDAQGPAGRGGGLDPDRALDYIDATRLLRDHQARYQAAMYGVALLLGPMTAQGSPKLLSGHAVSPEFFPMLELPFHFGSSWSAADEAGAGHVVVIGSQLNQQLFGGHDSVGRVLTLDGHDFRVVGVMAPWNPQPQFYDLFNSQAWSNQGEQLFIPLNTAIAMQEGNNGTTNCSTGNGNSSFQALLGSTCVWLSMMVELDSPAAERHYRAYLDNYARTQQATGRYAWAPNNRLRDLPHWLAYLGVVPPDTRISSWIALSLLLVCMVNTIGLLLAKFMRRRAEIAVRRALGATRRAIHLQFLCEAALVGVAGVLLSLLLTAAGIWGMGELLLNGVASEVRFSLSLLITSALLGLLTTVLAGLYPAWTASRIQPALQLKIS